MMVNHNSSLSLIKERAKSQTRSRLNSRRVDSRVKQRLTNELNKYEAYKQEQKMKELRQEKTTNHTKRSKPDANQLATSQETFAAAKEQKTKAESKWSLVLTSLKGINEYTNYPFNKVRKSVSSTKLSSAQNQNQINDTEMTMTAGINTIVLVKITTRTSFVFMKVENKAKTKNLCNPLILSSFLITFIKSKKTQVQLW